MAVKKGTLSIDSENIFPIIKKWVYSDHDIFVRELVSNGCDAITKLKKLDMMGEYELPEGYKPKIEVIVNPEEKTMKFIDNGLGMTAEEVEEYITQIAFSGATQFLEKYKDKTTEDDMIGHFGLGFYSAFMVADEVQIDTLSYKEGAKPVHWASEGGTEYEMQDGNKTTVGTEITLYLNEDSLEFANEYRAREVLERYCSFMPTEIFLSKANAEPEYDTIDEDDVLDTDTVVEHITEELCSLDSEHGQTYKDNAEAYETQLKELDTAFRDVVENAKNHTLLFGDRFPFRYFAAEYGLDYYAAFSGCASDTEPSAATMAFLINKVKEEHIPVVLKMELSNDNIANAIAEACDVPVKVFYSSHNISAKQFEAGVTYLDLMKENVETLKEALR